MLEVGFRSFVGVRVLGEAIVEDLICLLTGCFAEKFGSAIGASSHLDLLCKSEGEEQEQKEVVEEETPIVCTDLN